MLPSQFHKTAALKRRIFTLKTFLEQAQIVYLDRLKWWSVTEVQSSTIFEVLDLSLSSSSISLHFNHQSCTPLQL